jgi:hypothetical protein
MGERPRFIDRSNRIDCLSSNGKGMGEGISRVPEDVRALGKYALTDEDAEHMAYAGYPEIQAALFEPYSEGVSTAVIATQSAEATMELAEATDETPLHKLPDGRAKLLTEATTAAERAAIFKHTVSVVYVTPLEAAEQGGLQATRPLTQEAL